MIVVLWMAVAHVHVEATGCAHGQMSSTLDWMISPTSLIVLWPVGAGRRVLPMVVPLTVMLIRSSVAHMSRILSWPGIFVTALLLVACMAVVLTMAVGGVFRQCLGILW